MYNATQASATPASIAVSIRTAADMLELPDFTIREAVYVGALPAVRIGSALRVATGDLLTWFKAQA